MTTLRLPNVQTGPIPYRKWSRALLVGVVMVSTSSHAEVRRPAVAGSFYPGGQAKLETVVRTFLTAPGVSSDHPIALIVPHAGYDFSGPTAGRAFAELVGAKVERVILLGPSHYTGFNGGALPPPGTTAFATPLGEVPLDVAAIDGLRAFPEFEGPPEAHRPEHCLEVELPFLQASVGGVPIVPILVGHGTTLEDARAMAHRLAALLTPRTVVVASSDFTHHGTPYGYAPFAGDSRLGERLVELGRLTAGRAAAVDPRGFWNQVEASQDTVCGARPIAVLLELLAHASNGHGRVAAVTTSGEVSGNWSQVVTYAAVDFSGAWTSWRDDRPAPVLGTLDAASRKAILELARATLQSHLRHDGSLAAWFAANPVTGSLDAPAGVFVTVNNRGAKAAREGRLRGCIGVMEAHEPLVDAVIHSAVSAAHDPRFPALDERELDQVGLEVSVLSPLHKVPGPEAIELGRHGVVLSKGGRRAVFLPQVATETGWDRDTFLSQLSLKAGLPADAWRLGATFEVFTAQVFGEHE